MPQPIGSVIEPIANSVTNGPDRKPDSGASVEGTNGNAGGGKDTPEFIAGIESFQPSTIRIDDYGVGARTTRGGKVDGRTRAGRAARAAGATETGAAETPIQNTLSKLGVSDVLFTIHLMLAGLTGVKELKLDKEESKQLADAVQEVGKHYSVMVQPKTLAWMNLAGVMGTVYGTRIMAHSMKPKAVSSGAGQPEKVQPITAKPKVNGAPAVPSDLWNSAPIDSTDN